MLDEDTKALKDFLKFLEGQTRWELYKLEIMNCPICQKRDEEWQKELKEEFKKREGKTNEIYKKS